MSANQAVLESLYRYILEGDIEKATGSTKEGLSLGIEPGTLVYEGMVPGLREVGRRFESGEYFLPEMLVSARAMQASMDVVRPMLAEADSEPIATFVMGTVAGDIHDIGKNIVNAMLEGGGFRVIDLGVNVPAEAFTDAIREHRPEAVGMSAFLTTTMPAIKTNLEALETAGLRDQVKVLIGGAPLDQEYADHIGADGYAPDANSAVRVTRKLIGLD